MRMNMTGTTIETLTKTPNQQREGIQVLGVEQVAARLGLPKSSVYEMTRFRGSSGQVCIPCRRIGRYLKFLSSDIDNWLLALPLTVNRTKRRYHRKVDAAEVPITASAKRKVGRA
jgi:predicted DNA-binding transcriptional regulator AlpA